MGGDGLIVCVFELQLSETSPCSRITSFLLDTQLGLEAEGAIRFLFERGHLFVLESDGDSTRISSTLLKTGMKHSDYSNSAYMRELVHQQFRSNNVT